MLADHDRPVSAEADVIIQALLLIPTVVRVLFPLITSSTPLHPLIILLLLGFLPRPRILPRIMPRTQPGILIIVRASTDNTAYRSILDPILLTRGKQGIKVREAAVQRCAVSFVGPRELS